MSTTVQLLINGSLLDCNVLASDVTENGELRTIHTLGTIMVVTTRDDRTVITVGNRH